MNIKELLEFSKNIKTLQEKSKQKDPDAQRELTRLLSENPEVIEIQTTLGKGYYKGQGIKQDYTEAVKWFKLAAEYGSKNDQNTLGACYFAGKGVEQDSIASFKGYQKAVDQGLTEAQQNLELALLQKKKSH